MKYGTVMKQHENRTTKRVRQKNRYSPKRVRSRCGKGKMHNQNIDYPR